MRRKSIMMGNNGIFHIKAYTPSVVSFIKKPYGKTEQMCKFTEKNDK